MAKYILILAVLFQSCVKGQYLGMNSSYPTKKAIFTFIFDDQNTSDTTVFRILKEYKFISNFAIRTGTMTAAKYAIYRRYIDSGSTIIAHSVNHGTYFNTAGTNPVTITAEMNNSKNTLQDSLGITVNGWVTPQSLLHSNFYSIVDGIFDYAYVDSGGVFNETVLPTRLSRYSLESNLQAAITARVDLAIANKELITFYAHRLPSTSLDGDGNTVLSEAKLRAVLAYIRAKCDLRLCRVLNTANAILKYYE